jgi:hypothetical protein
MIYVWMAGKFGNDVMSPDVYCDANPNFGLITARRFEE